MFCDLIPFLALYPKALNNCKHGRSPDSLFVCLPVSFQNTVALWNTFLLTQKELTVAGTVLESNKVPF
jgi:hypothetical protein